MKKGIKILIVLMSLLLGISLASGCSSKDKEEPKENAETSTEDKSQKSSEKSDEPDKKAEQEINAENEKERINAVLLGTDVGGGSRTDTIMFITYDVKNNKVDVISVPRDTYYYESTHAGAQSKKINAAYTFDGVDGTIKAVEDVLGIPGEISYYAKLDYDGVKNIVNSVGGVEVYVPQSMTLVDEFSDPVMIKDIQSGTYKFDGQEALAYLRQRKSYPDGDLGRVNAQQQFLYAFIDEINGLNLANVISTSIKEVDTNLGLQEALYYGVKGLSLEKSNITMHVIPGEQRYQELEGENLSFFIRDEAGIEQLMDEVMNRPQ